MKPFHSASMKRLLAALIALAIWPVAQPAGLGAGEDLRARGYAGDAACLDCHEPEFESYTRGPHGMKADVRSPAARYGCETCHGPSLRHVRTDGEVDVPGLILLKPTAPTPVQERNAVCLDCHSTTGKVALWSGSPHERRDLACSNCHDPHSGHSKELAKATQHETCADCHMDVASQIRQVSRHPIRDGKMDCSDCHNPHGSMADRMIAASWTSEQCFECHAEKRGPYLWEHPPVTENCTTCHTPHGSNHDKLLVAKVPFLCQQCHSEQRHPGTLYAIPADRAGESVYQVLNQRAFYRGCVNCHVTVHGSNHPSGNRLLR